MLQVMPALASQTLDGLARDAFPVFHNYPDIIYFDSAATTQKPHSVIQIVNDYHHKAVNIGRGEYSWSVEGYERIQAIRKKIAQFLHAHSPAEVVFTSGATASFNTICHAWGLANLKHEDEILLCAADHKSSTLPWLNLKRQLQQFGISLKIIFYGVDDTGKIDSYELLSKITTKTRLIALTHINNVYGNLNDIAAIRARLPHNILLSLDASQSIGHINIDVQQLDIDFLSYSGHKMFASTGIGVLWINQKLHNQLHPAIVGGGNGSSALQPATDDFIAAAMPDLLEAGTQHIAGILSLGAATEFIQALGIETIHSYVADLTMYMIAQLQTINQLEFVPPKRFQHLSDAYGIISIRFAGLSAGEVGSILEQHNIFVRTGDHCMSRSEERDDSLRISLHLYNTKHEIDLFIQILKDLIL